MPHSAEHADTEPHRRRARAPERVVRLGSLPVDSEQDLWFVQHRLSLFGKTTFLISTMFLIGTTSADLVSDIPRYSALGRASHVLGTLIAFAMWRIAGARRNLSPAELGTLDVVSTLGICWAFVSTGHFAAQPYGFYTGLLATTHVSISRAIIVPSLPQRTLQLAIASFGASVLSRATMPWSLMMSLTLGSRGRGVFEALLWAIAGVAVSTIASRVIYGLRKKALEARQLGQYTLEEKIGQGGMGEVYRARHAMLRRPTAVKLLAGDGSEDQLRRFEKEVRLTAQLTHPNTISVYDYGRTPDGIFYYAMELLEGSTLEQLVERHGPQPPGRVVHLLRQVSGALKEAHRAGLIHRDIKPANIFLCRRGGVPDYVKVLDFGLVRQIRGSDDVSGSNVHAVVGTPLYLAPEAIVSPDKIDARVDIYGLGGVAYFLSTGTPPFSGANVVEVCAHHLHTPVEPPSRRCPLPSDLEGVILACLAKDPEQRLQSAGLLLEALEACVDARSWTEADAERWWLALDGSTEPAAQSSAASAEQPRRTFCAVDLGARLEHDDETGS